EDELDRDEDSPPRIIQAAPEVTNEETEVSAGRDDGRYHEGRVGHGSQPEMDQKRRESTERRAENRRRGEGLLPVCSKEKLEQPRHGDRKAFVSDQWG